MSVHASDNTFITIIDATDVAELVCSVLEFSGYRVQRANVMLGKVTAALQQSESCGRLTWHYNFQVVIEWLTDTHGSSVDITVKEFQHDDNDTRNECQKRSSDLALSILEAADKTMTVTSKKDTRYGSAEFGTLNELIDKGYFSCQSDSTRLILAPLSDGHILLPTEFTAHHAIVCGPTGTGKTSGIFIPNLIERLATSMIVTEATAGKNQPPELLVKTAGWRKMAGHKIFSFNPQDMSSTRVNPIDLVRLATDDDVANKAEALADLVIKNTNPPREVRTDPMWEKSEKFLLMSLILHAAASESKYAHLGAIRWNLLKGHHFLSDLLDDSPSELAADQFYGFLENTTEGIRNGVVTGLLGRLNPWLTPQIIALTYCTDFQLEELQESLFTFYLSAPVRRTEMKAIAALTLNFLIDLSVELKFKHGLALLLDEFTNFGYIQGVPGLLSIIRKTGISAVLGFQDFAQLIEVYGPTSSEIILSQPGTTVFYKPRTHKQAMSISNALGTQTFHDRVVTSSGQTIEKFIPRQLMTPDELLSLKKYEAIIFTPTTKPIRLMTHTWQDYQEATSYPPPINHEHVINDWVRNGGRTGPRQKRSTTINPVVQNHHKGTGNSAHESHETEMTRNPDEQFRDRDSPTSDLFGEQ